MFLQTLLIFAGTLVAATAILSSLRPFPKQDLFWA